jgi:hypothetical protein
LGGRTSYLGFLAAGAISVCAISDARCRDALILRQQPFATFVSPLQLD